MRILFLDMDGVIANLPQGQSSRWGEVGFWETLPKYEWSDDLVALCLERYQTHICSSIGGGPMSVSGKILWLRHHYPELADNAVFTRCKHLLAGPLRILVDDDFNNIDFFEQRGGVGLLWPNPERFPDYTDVDGGPNKYTKEEVMRWLKEHS